MSGAPFAAEGIGGRGAPAFTGEGFGAVFGLLGGGFGGALGALGGAAASFGAGAAAGLCAGAAAAGEAAAGLATFVNTSGGALIVAPAPGTMVGGRGAG